MNTDFQWPVSTPRRAALKFFAFTMALLAQGFAVAQDASSNQSAAVQRAESVVRRFWDAFNREAWAELDDLVTAGYAHHPPGKTLSLAQFKAGGAWVHNGLASYRLQIDSMLATEREVAIRWTATGIHVGSLFGEPPSNRDIKVQGMHFHALVDGRVSEDWEVIDFDGFKAQLGRR